MSFGTGHWTFKRVFGMFDIPDIFDLAIWVDEKLHLFVLISINNITSTTVDWISEEIFELKVIIVERATHFGESVTGVVGDIAGEL
jgi:hypothetical protein